MPVNEDATQNDRDNNKRETASGGEGVNALEGAVGAASAFNDFRGTVEAVAVRVEEIQQEIEVQRDEALEKSGWRSPFLFARFAHSAMKCLARSRKRKMWRVLYLVSYVISRALRPGTRLRTKQPTNHQPTTTATTTPLDTRAN